MVRPRRGQRPRAGAAAAGSLPPFLHELGHERPEVGEPPADESPERFCPPRGVRAHSTPVALLPVLGLARGPLRGKGTRVCEKPFLVTGSLTHRSVRGRVACWLHEAADECSGCSCGCC